jgi:hypothetical protein
VFDNELFCDRHFNSKTKPKDKWGHVRKTVPKTGLESQLKISYSKKLERCILPEDYEKLNIEFKKDVEIIIKQNPIYKNNP